jgi:RNase P/RNase MRP subunit p29
MTEKDSFFHLAEKDSFFDLLTKKRKKGQDKMTTRKTTKRNSHPIYRVGDNVTVVGKVCRRGMRGSVIKVMAKMVVIVDDDEGYMNWFSLDDVKMTKRKTKLFPIYRVGDNVTVAGEVHRRGMRGPVVKETAKMVMIRDDERFLHWFSLDDVSRIDMM